MDYKVVQAGCLPEVFELVTAWTKWHLKGSPLVELHFKRLPYPNGDQDPTVYSITLYHYQFRQYVLGEEV